MRNGSENVLMELKVVFGPNQVMQCMVSKIWNKVQKCTVYKFLPLSKHNKTFKFDVSYFKFEKNWEVFNWIYHLTMWDKLN